MASSNSTIAPNGLLKFHPVHGENVLLTNDERSASRSDGYCKGVAFSSRPIKVDETVSLRIVDVRSGWNGTLRLGITNKDPTSFGEIPRYLCPDMVSAHEHACWAKALTETAATKSNIVSFYIQENGEMFVIVNGNMQGLFLHGVNTRLPMFVVMDIYGTTMAIEFVDDVDVPSYRRKTQSLAPTSTRSSNNTPSTSAAPSPPVSVPPTPGPTASVPAPVPKLPAPPQRPAPIAMPQSQAASSSTSTTPQSPQFPTTSRPISAPRQQDFTTMAAAQQHPSISLAPGPRPSPYKNIEFIGRTRIPDPDPLEFIGRTRISYYNQVPTDDQRPGPSTANSDSTSGQQAGASTRNSAAESSSSQWMDFAGSSSHPRPKFLKRVAPDSATVTAALKDFDFSTLSPTPTATATAPSTSNGQRPVIQSISEQRQRDLLDRVAVSRNQHDLLMSNPRLPPSGSTGNDHVNRVPLRYQGGINFEPMQFHNISGLNIVFDPSRTTAGKNESAHRSDHGYAFTWRPIRPYEKVLIHIASVAPGKMCSMGFGVTNCDPIKLMGYAFPDDPDDFYQRNEFWATKKSVSGDFHPSMNDEFGFFIDDQGNVYCDRNGQPPIFVMCVDPTLPYYFFFDLCGSTRSIRVVGTAILNKSYVDDLRACGSGADQQSSRMNNNRPGALTVKLPPAQLPHLPLASALPQMAPLVPSVRNPLPPPLVPDAAQAAAQPAQAPPQPPPVQVQPTASASASVVEPEPIKECTICMSNEVQCAMIPCGHAVTCMDCGNATKTRHGTCPICRHVVQSVLKLYYAGRSN